MLPQIVVYIPVRNNVAWCQEVPLPQGLKYVASDNASTDGSGEALQKRGVDVIFQETDIGRIGNWAACVQHFLASGATWMKWLFAGDTLADDFGAVAARAIAASPEARMIVGDYVHESPTVRSLARLMPSTRLFTPIESLRMAAAGNWFHAPINQMFHRDALVGGIDYGPFVWGADFYFCVNVASKAPVLYWQESFGTFHEISRAHFLRTSESIQSLLEVYWVRQIAASRLKALTGDAAEFAALSAGVEDSALRRLIAHVANRRRSGRMMLAAWRVVRKAGRAFR
jgi:hypothetical protein